MANPRWSRKANCVYNLGYHIIWCPKYRRKVLTGAVESDLKDLLEKKAGDLGISIEKMEIMPDHVHLFVKCDPTDSPSWVVSQLKGYTSHELRAKHHHLKSRLPTLWTRSFYVESIGHISEDTIKRYIEDQKTA